MFLYSKKAVLDHFAGACTCRLIRRTKKGRMLPIVLVGATQPAGAAAAAAAHQGLDSVVVEHSHKVACVSRGLEERRPRGVRSRMAPTQGGLAHVQRAALRRLGVAVWSWPEPVEGSFGLLETELATNIGWRRSYW